MNTKTAKALVRLGFAFFVLNACSSLFIWIISQFKPEINIELLYQIEKFVSYLLVGSISLSILSGVVMKYLNQQVFKLDNLEDLFNKSFKQNVRWLGYFFVIFWVSEIVQGLFGHLATQVKFSHGSWVLIIPRSSPIQVTETIAHDRMWNQCRACSGMSAFIYGTSVLGTSSFIKLCNRSSP